MDRKRLDINDYQNASDEFKKDVAFANDVLDKVHAKIGKAMKVDDSRLGGTVHGYEYVFEKSLERHRCIAIPLETITINIPKGG